MLAFEVAAMAIAGIAATVTLLTAAFRWRIASRRRERHAMRRHLDIYYGG